MYGTNTLGIPVLALLRIGVQDILQYGCASRSGRSRLHNLPLHVVNFRHVDVEVAALLGRTKDFTGVLGKARRALLRRVWSSDRSYL
jgi:hypothetical protein